MLPTGFHIEENIISSVECDDLTRLLSNHSLDRSRAGARNLMRFDFVAKLASDERLLRVTELVYGQRLTPYKATLFEKTGKANWLVAWHQDTALPIEEFKSVEGWSAPSRKAGTLFAQAPATVLSKILAVRIHLDASTETNGPLRVIPGSHLEGVLDERKLIGWVATKEGFVCVVGRGGVIAMSPLVLHASSKVISDEPRRVLHIEYASSRDLDEGIRLAIA